MPDMAALKEAAQNICEAKSKAIKLISVSLDADDPEIRENCAKVALQHLLNLNLPLDDVAKDSGAEHTMDAHYTELESDSSDTEGSDGNESDAAEQILSMAFESSDDPRERRGLLRKVLKDTKSYGYSSPCLNMGYDKKFPKADMFDKFKSRKIAERALRNHAYNLIFTVYDTGAFPQVNPGMGPTCT